jgi:hypothetical protein
MEGRHILLLRYLISTCVTDSRVLFHTAKLYLIHVFRPLGSGIIPGFRESPYDLCRETIMALIQALEQYSDSCQKGRIGEGCGPLLGFPLYLVFTMFGDVRFQDMKISHEGFLRVLWDGIHCPTPDVRNSRGVSNECI